MRAYVLVDHSRVAVTVYCRIDADAWEMEFLVELDSTLDLPEIGCSLPLRSMYDRLPFAL